MDLGLVTRSTQYSTQVYTESELFVLQQLRELVVFVEQNLKEQENKQNKPEKSTLL